MNTHSKNLQGFSKRLEQKLNLQDTSLRYEVINGGCSSYSPILEYLFLVYKGLTYHPDLVILNYDLSDVQDDYKYSQIAEVNTEGYPTKVHPIDVQWYYKEPGSGFASTIPFLQDSALYQFVMKRYYQWKGEQNAPLFYSQAKAIAGNIEYDRDITYRDYSIDWKKHFDHSAQYLKMIANLLHSQQMDFAIASYPNGPLLSPKEWAIGRKIRGFDEKVYQTRLFDYLEEFGAKENIPYLNMMPAFQQAEKTQFPLFFPYDGHFNPAGHEVAAEALFDFVQKQYPASTQSKSKH